MVGVATAVTNVVPTVKVADDAPGRMDTVLGTVAAALLLDSVTTTPAAGAGPFKVTLPADDAGPTTLVGFSATVSTANENGLSVSVAVCVAPDVAEIVTAVSVVTEVVFTMNVAEVDPSGIVTLEGTVTA